MKKSALKTLLLVLLFCLAPLLCSAEILVLKGTIKGVGFEAISPGLDGYTGSYYKGKTNLYLVLDVTGNMIDYTSSVTNAYAIAYDAAGGEVLPFSNLAIVVDEFAPQVGLASSDLFNDGLVGINTKLVVAGKAAEIDLGTTVIAFAKSLKGTLIYMDGSDVATEAVALKFDSGSTKSANLELGGEIIATVNALVDMLIGKGIPFNPT